MNIEKLGSGLSLTLDNDKLYCNDMITLADNVMSHHVYREMNLELAVITPNTYRDSEIHLVLRPNYIEVAYNPYRNTYIPSGDIFRLAQWLYACNNKIKGQQT